MPYTLVPEVPLAKPLVPWAYLRRYLWVTVGIAPRFRYTYEYRCSHSTVVAVQNRIWPMIFFVLFQPQKFEPIWISTWAKLRFANNHYRDGKGTDDGPEGGLTNWLRISYRMVIDKMMAMLSMWTAEWGSEGRHQLYYSICRAWDR